MNNTVRDLLLIIIIVTLCLSLYMNKVEMEKVNKRLINLECEVHNLKNNMECLEETCDGRFECCMNYWVAVEYRWY